MFPSSFVLVDRKLQSTLSCGRMSQNWMSNTLYTAELNLGKIRSVFNKPRQRLFGTVRKFGQLRLHKMYGVTLTTSKGELLIKGKNKKDDRNLDKTD